MKQTTQSLPGRDSPAIEVLVDCITKHRSLVGTARGTIEMDLQCQRAIVRQLLAPRNDEVFRVRVQITATKRRRVRKPGVLP